ncbi:protein translocase subunit SecD [Candidatus Gottesmanbacteria bacterium CG11_big_fil_rev_8_21_14_0_20_37_11]|uniref:Protein translocase subunit SecD n=4 Tax=Candidatus Gottesmaniibacteriota TaxID=1752720 RepID=A0A1J4U055_9BACT|nr:MAG: protein-export membrane protein SecD [Candidatus Gottesmanbacteria bacterium CG1_02_37_22]PIR07794.1 MAG: protein translocase subunit SecD [Candidatus Gottesmanbacteria bacterium CG11_big_fil_rev_8_21_14_0_20_37_11]
MKSKRKLLWFIIFLVLFSTIVDLPQNYRIKFDIGSMKIDRVINAPSINIDLGRIKIKNDLKTHLGLDLSGGTHLVLEADMKNISSSDKEKAFDSAKNIVERRINLFGLTEPIVQKTKVGNSFRIIVEIPGISDVSSAIDLIGKTAQLAFYEEASQTANLATPSSVLELWSKKTDLTGSNLKRAEVTFDSKTGKPEVALEFDKVGAKLFEDITTQNVGKTVAIFLDDQLLSAPRVNEPIVGGKAVIQGNFSMDEAKRLSVSLNAGALPVPLKILEQRNIGATLGRESIDRSLIAGVIGLCIVGLFMLVNYGLLGLVADVALVIYTLMVFAMFKLIPVTLTLAGIAGFILSIGMAVDANILIFERMKEEIRWGKDYIHALSLGFDRAFPSIRDSNISSLITCGILYWFGTGIVRGFAITLAVGIVVSLFSAITITRSLLKLIYR